MRYYIKLSYCGAGFNGWQVQPDAPSVQAEIEKALSTLLRTRTPVTGAGRTDTGVNARGYIAHFDANLLPDRRNLVYKLNAILPPGISVQEIGPAQENFHARFSATGRQYTYFLHRVKDPFIDSSSYFCNYPGLDFALMNRAAALIEGRHDFRCFEKTGADSKTSICTVFSASWSPYEPVMPAWQTEEAKTGVPCSPADDTDFNSFRYWRFDIKADRFLRNMVRAVVGTLIEVGRGKRDMENFASLILPADYGESSAATAGTHPRCAAGESVPGKALFLSAIEYPSF